MFGSLNSILLIENVIETISIIFHNWQSAKSNRNHQINRYYETFNTFTFSIDSFVIPAVGTSCSVFSSTSKNEDYEIAYE